MLRQRNTSMYGNFHVYDFVDNDIDHLSDTKIYIEQTYHVSRDELLKFNFLSVFQFFIKLIVLHKKLIFQHKHFFKLESWYHYLGLIIMFAILLCIFRIKNM